MAEASLTVTYEGPALDLHRMDVRELAPALLALADAVQESNEILDPGAPPVSLHISATAEGSFLLDLILVQPDLPSRLIDAFSGDSATALANLIAIVGAPSGVIALIVKIRGRKVSSVQPGAPGQVTITLEDGESISFPADTLRVYRSVKVRRRLKRFMEPLSKEGIDAVRLTADETIEVTAEDRTAFDVADVPATPIIDQVAPMAVAIASVAFVEGNKWRLSDGDRTFYAAIADETFLGRVDRGQEAFRKGDILRCDMRIVQTQDEDGLHTEWIVDRVVEHIPAAVPIELDLYGDLDPDEDQ